MNKAHSIKGRSEKYTGSCLCGKVRYEVAKFEPLMGHCHCTMCQKFHGAAFSTFAEVKLENLNWLSGQENLKSYQAKNDSIRQFCNTCGSSLSFSSSHNREAGTIELAIATLDDSQGIVPCAHIFTATKMPWLELKDDLPKYQEYR